MTNFEISVYSRDELVRVVSSLHDGIIRRNDAGDTLEGNALLEQVRIIMRLLAMEGEETFIKIHKPGCKSVWLTDEDNDKLMTIITQY